MCDPYMNETDYCIQVLNRIREYMNKGGVKQSELAKISGINQSTLSKIMKGEAKLTIQYICRLCKALKIDPGVLLSFDQKLAMNSLDKTNHGVINKDYTNEHILIRDTTHPAFKGYITDMPFHIYLYSTISSELSILEGEIKFEDTEYHDYCKATMCLYIGRYDSDGNEIKKVYEGELIVSLTMGACYCILINPEIGEICTLNFKHTFLFNQQLVCRVATVVSTSSGSNKLPVMQRALITDRKLNVNELGNPDFDFARGQLKLNDSEIVLTDNSFTEIKTIQEKESGELKKFLFECITPGSKLYDSMTYYVLDETKIRSINVPSDVKAQGISLLRNFSISLKYNKISNKTEEYTFQYITRKKTSHSNG